MWRLIRARWVRFPHASATFLPGEQEPEGCAGPIASDGCLRGTYISRLAPHVSTPTLMALARHRDYRTTRRYVQVDGSHLRAAVERLTEPGCHPATALVDSLLASAKSEGETS